MPETLTPERVLAVLEEAGGRPLKAKDVSKALGLGADDRGEVRAALRQLVDDGLAEQLEGRRFAVVDKAAAGKGGKGGSRSGSGVEGVVQRKASGVGWFVPVDKNFKDGFLPPQELKLVVDGDRVRARLEKGHRGQVATIVEVISHSRDIITGTLRTANDPRFGRQAFLEVDDNIITGPVRIRENPSRTGGSDPAKDGDVVEVKLVEYPSAAGPAEGIIVRRIGEKGALDVEVERLIVGSGVVRAFPPEAVAQAESHGEDPGPEDIAGRLDLRALPIVTIDGETAKDFDDAVYATPGKRKGTLDVIVCVADVSHYVTLHSPLDEEARRRATSIYYPGRVVPMLPEALSNGLCSLKPRVPRLCAVVEFVVDANGGVTDEKFAFGVMKSAARLTYSLVQRFLDEEDNKAVPYEVPPQPQGATATTSELTDEVKDSLRHLADAARRLRAARSLRGALDFELPEIVIDLDVRKEPIGLRHLDRAFSHKLIEDLMIAANEAAARFFDTQDFPSVYRIHEVPDPEKLERFLNLARPALLATGQKLPKQLLDDAGSSQGLMAVLNGLGDHPARASLDMLLLRSMKQARYAVDNVGHYGLGSEAYLHFTSPIRRYPDLIVHRLLRERIGKKKRKKGGEEGEDDALISELEDIAMTSSEQERKASDLERAISQLHACWLMKDRIGEVHPAVVTGVSEAGAFVRLEDLFVEGLVRMQDLGSEYFSYDEEAVTLRGERSRDVITFGVKFEVEVVTVDLTRRQVGFLRAGPLVKPEATRSSASPSPKSSSSSASSSRSSYPPPSAPSSPSSAPARSARAESTAKIPKPKAAEPWSPRTDARPGVPQGKKKKKKAAASAPPPPKGKTGGSSKEPPSKKDRRQRVDEQVRAAAPKKKGADLVPLPDPHGRGRGEKQRLQAYETALRHVEDGTATPEERIYVEERQAYLTDRQETRFAAARERSQRQTEHQKRYDDQQQTSTRKLKDLQQEPLEPKPEPPAKIRGPDDLRALFESRGGRAVGGGGNKKAKKKSKAPKKKPTR